MTNQCALALTPDSSIPSGFHKLAAFGGGPAHWFQVGTGFHGLAVGIEYLSPEIPATLKKRL